MAPTQDCVEPPLEVTLKKNPQLSLTDLNYLRGWIKKQPHLPQLTETELVPFLHSNQYSLEKTKVCIDKYFTMRTLAPELLGPIDIDDEKCKQQLDLMHYVELQKRDAHGNRILCMYLRTKDASTFNYDLFTRTAYNFLDVVIREDPTAPGYVFVTDSSNASFGHITKIPLASMSKSASYFQEALPLRLKALHVINVNPVTDALMTLAKPFIGEELKNMLHFHSGEMQAFYDEIPKDILPKELGGTAGAIKDYKECIEIKLEKRKDWIQQYGLKLVDESKRQDKKTSSGGVFGMEGSFKKLDID